MSKLLDIATKEVIQAIHLNAAALHLIHEVDAYHHLVLPLEHLLGQNQVVVRGESQYQKRQLHLDRLLTSRATGLPVMLALLLVVVWLTVSGANYPSQLLQSLFDSGYLWLAGLAAQWGLPWYLSGPLLDGVYTTVARVVDRKSTRLNSSHTPISRMPSSA